MSSTPEVESFFQSLERKSARLRALVMLMMLLLTTVNLIAYAEQNQTTRQNQAILMELEDASTVGGKVYELDRKRTAEAVRSIVSSTVLQVCLLTETVETCLPKVQKAAEAASTAP